jgi:hypothetical protein
MAGSSLKVRVRRIAIWQLVLATTAAFVDIAVLRLSTAGTGGSSITPAPLDTTDSASGATAMSLPTGKGTETTTLMGGIAYFAQTILATVQPAPSLVWEYDADRSRSKPIIIPAGTSNGIAIKLGPATAGASVQISVTLDESNF